MMLARLALALAVGTAAQTVAAQVSVVLLHPPGAGESIAFGIGDGQIVGMVTVSGSSRASLWTLQGSAWVDLTPGPATNGFAFAAAGGQEVGRAQVAGVGRASLWTGSESSWIDLSQYPLGYRESVALGTSGNQQVGYVLVSPTVTHASLWAGTAASWVDLHPSVASYSQALAAQGGQQVGWAGIGGHSHASVWTGGPGTWIDLHPTQAELQSECYGVFAGVQVGSAAVNGRESAALWRGAASTWVDLNPPGATRSQARAAGEDGQQVGMADPCGGWRAARWCGTAASWLDLHAALPPGFTTSRASAMWSDATTAYAVGSAFNAAAGREEAILWQWPKPSVGACCAGAACSIALPTECGGSFLGLGSACGSSDVPTPCCRADLDSNGQLTVADVFAYLSSWFASAPRSEFNGDCSLTVADIFAFLNAWFSGCP